VITGIMRSCLMDGALLHSKIYAKTKLYSNDTNE
jgi:hypothetical protein